MSQPHAYIKIRLIYSLIRNAKGQNKQSAIATVQKNVRVFTVWIVVYLTWDSERY